MTRAPAGQRVAAAVISLASTTMGTAADWRRGTGDSSSASSQISDTASSNGFLPGER
jgi:hypothetical protein